MSNTEAQPTQLPQTANDIADVSQQGHEAPLGQQFVHQNRFSQLDVEDTIESTYVTGDPNNPLDYWEYPAEYREQPWSTYNTRKRNKELYDAMSVTGKRKHNRLIRMEEIREGKSILVFEVEHLEIGVDYEINEVQKAWPIFVEISKASMGERGCDVKPTNIEDGHRLWKWKGDEKKKEMKKAPVNL